MSRRTDRKHAFSLIFQLEFQPGGGGDEAFARYFDSIIAANDANYDFIRELYMGVIDNKEKIDALIAESSEGWSMDRISKTDIAILRLCVYEFLFSMESRKVAINEAIELAKQFSPDEKGAFVNGLLGKTLKILESREQNA